MKPGCHVLIWKDLGFLEGLTKEMSILCAKNLSAMARYFITEEHIGKVCDINAESVIFAVIRKITTNTRKELLSPEKLYNSFCTFIEDNCKRLKETRHRFKIDMEAEVCVAFANEASEIIKNSAGNE